MIRTGLFYDADFKFALDGVMNPELRYLVDVFKEVFLGGDKLSDFLEFIEYYKEYYDKHAEHYARPRSPGSLYP